MDSKKDSGLKTKGKMPVTNFQAKNKVNSRHYSAYKNNQKEKQKLQLNNSRTTNFKESQKKLRIGKRKAKN